MMGIAAAAAMPANSSHRRGDQSVERLRDQAIQNGAQRTKKKALYQPLIMKAVLLSAAKHAQGRRPWRPTSNKEAAAIASQTRRRKPLIA